MNEVVQKKIPQRYYKDALEWFFHSDRRIPFHEKKSIKEIHVLKEDRILVIFAENQNLMFKNVKYLAIRTGWYFYITGAPLEKDEITEYVDNLKISAKKLDFNWQISEKFEVKLIPITPGLNQNSYLLKVINDNLKEINILLDGGFESMEIYKLLGNTNSLDLIFLSHAHGDHIKGIPIISKTFPNTPILSSRTTFEYYILYNWFTGEKFNLNKIKIDSLSRNWHFIKNNEILESLSLKVKFYYAGHLPGALMFFLELFDFKFLYTGDFSYFDTFPIAGVKNQLSKLPKEIDFCLIDGTFSSSRYEAPSHIFNVFKDKVTNGIKYKNRILIAADYGSSALVLFLTLFSHFRTQQKKLGLKAKRPNIYLLEGIRRFFQIMTHNKDGLHLYLKKLISEDYNPFQSAIIKWIHNYSELKNAINKDGGIFILPNSDLRNKMTRKAFELISQYKNNIVYLCGPLRYKTAIELSSGNDNVTLGGKKIINKSVIWNRKYPNLVLNLHSDSIQLEKLIKSINPKNLCFFQQNPKSLIKVRANLSKNFYDIKTTAIYKDSIEEMIIHKTS